MEVWIANCDLDVKAQEGKGRNRGLKVESNDPHITTFHLTTQDGSFSSSLAIGSECFFSRWASTKRTQGETLTPHS